MSADTFDPILGLLLMGTGNDNNSWGGNANTSVFSPAARAIAGVNIITATSGTVDLSTVVPPAGLRLDIDYIQKLNGSLTGDLTIIVPNVQKTWMFWNQSSSIHGVYVKVPGGVAPTTPTGLGGLAQIPSSKMIIVACDGAGNIKRSDEDDVGSFRISGKAAAANDEIPCDGTSYLRTLFPNLFAKIGTTWGSVDGTHFTVPNFTDTNRFLRTGGGSGPAVGTYQSNQNLAHSHTITGAPGVGSLGTDNPGNHTHANTVGETAHAHTASQGAHNTGQLVSIGTGAAGQGALAGLSGTGLTETALAGVTITNVGAGAHTHTITGAPSLGSLGSASSGGTEARPESAAVLICIRY